MTETPSDRDILYEVATNGRWSEGEQRGEWMITKEVYETVRDALASRSIKREAEWLPIGTAPNGDDDFFLVCGVGDDRSPFVVRGSILKSARRKDTPSHLHLHYLTHWMPLPEPPRALAQQPPSGETK